MSLAEKRLTAPEYLAIEREAQNKSEFFAGRMFAVAGASRQHVAIVANLTRELGSQFKGRPCQVFPSDMRVKIALTGLYTYPDVAAACGDMQFEDDHGDTLLNPVLIVEVLSPSTEAYDRGEKFANYRRLASLKEYVLVAQDRIRVEQYVRQADGTWLLKEQTNPQDVLLLSSVTCAVPLVEIYDKVDLPSISELHPPGVSC